MKNKQKPTAVQSREGSTIAAVLIAMVFIGIVTTSMLKNTSSQSAVSGSYGTVMTASSTVASGLVATESYFPGVNPDTVLRKLNEALKNPNDTANAVRNIYGSNNGRQQIGSSGNKQYFKSKITSIDSVAGKIYARIAVDGASRNGGREQKAAQGFYLVNAAIEQENVAAPGSNALYAGSLTGNAKVKIEGCATIENHYAQNIQGDLTFARDAQGRGDVYFHSTAMFVGRATFETKAFFNDKVDLGLGDGVTRNMFQDGVGFGGHLDVGTGGTAIFGRPTTPGGTTYTATNVWLNRGLRNYYSEPSITGGRVQGTGSLYYTSSFASDVNTSGKVNFTSKTQTTLSRETILGNLSMNDLPARREPSYDITKTAPGQFMTFTQLLASYGQGATSITASVLNRAYANAPSQYKDAKGNLLLKVNASNFGDDGTEFTGKVIFYADGNAATAGNAINVNGNLYKSSPESRSLFYLGGQSQLFQFGGAHDFYGMVYVDSTNTKDHTFSWSNTTEKKLNGAVIMKGGNLNAWNVSTGSTSIRRDDDVVKDFAHLTTAGSNSTGGSGGETNIVQKGSAGALEEISLKAIGFYFR
jgi:hypothetical protein